MASNKIDARQSRLTSAQGMLGSLSGDTLDTIFPKINDEIAKLFEDRNALLTDGGIITFTGTALQFTESLKISLNSKIDGSVQVFDLGSTTRSLSASGRMIYAVINRTAGTATVTADATALPAVTAANQEVFLIAKRVDATDGTKRVYFKSGFVIEEGQNIRLGSAGGNSANGGAVNLITDGSADNASATIFIPYSDSPSTTRPVDGTGGSPAVTSSVSTINPLIGAKSFLLTKPNSNTQGQGWSIPTTSLDVAYRAKSLKVSIDYIVNSGTFVAGSNNTESDVILYFYDITNAKLVEPSNIKFFSNSSTISDKIEATVQFDYNCTAFRTILHCQSNSASAYELKLDNVTVSPQASVYANSQTSPVQYQPTWTGLGTVTNNSMYWQRDGSDMILWGYVTTGTVTNNGVTFTLPNGYAIDTARLSSNLTRRHNFGYAHRLASGGNAIYSDGVSAATMAVVYQDSNTPQLTHITTTGAFGDTNAIGMFNSGESISISPLRIPILGWDASSRVSDSYDGREISGQVTISSHLAMTTNSPILFPVVTKDTTGSYNASTGQIKIPSAGEYEFTLTEAYNNTSGLYILLYRNGTPVSLMSYSSAAGILTMSYPAKINCNAGDLIDVRPSNNTNSLQYSAYTSGTGYIPKFSWKKNQNSQAISASEKVYCSYTSTSGQSIPNNSATTVLFGNKLEDTHGVFNTSNGRITLPRAGAGYINATINFSSPASATYYVQIFKNGSVYKSGVSIQGTTWGVPFSGMVSGVAGDYFDIRLTQNSGAAKSLDVNAVSNHFDFFMI
jgi:hypothetical protein